MKWIRENYVAPAADEAAWLMRGSFDLAGVASAAGASAPDVLLSALEAELGQNSPPSRLMTMPRPRSRRSRRVGLIWRSARTSCALCRAELAGAASFLERSGLELRTGRSSPSLPFRGRLQRPAMPAGRGSVRGWYGVCRLRRANGVRDEGPALGARARRSAQGATDSLACGGHPEDRGAERRS